MELDLGEPRTEDFTRHKWRSEQRRNRPESLFIVRRMKNMASLSELDQTEVKRVPTLHSQTEHQTLVRSCISEPAMSSMTRNRHKMSSMPRKRVWKRKAKVDRKNLKLWAEGSRESILRPHLEPYSAALALNWRAERDYRQLVCNEFHARISWRLADHEEPNTPLPDYDPLAPPEEEELSDEERQQKHERIKELNKASVSHQLRDRDDADLD